MRDGSKRPPVAERIRKGLEEAIRCHKGEITLKTTVLPPFPGKPPAKTDLAKDEAPR